MVRLIAYAKASDLLSLLGRGSATDGFRWLLWSTLEEASMKVSDILKEKGDRVMTVRPTEIVATLVHRLRAERVGAFVVSEDGHHMVGIVSERDVVGCLAQHGSDAPGVTVDRIMSSGVITCAPSDSLTVIARKMTDNRIRHLPVVEGGSLVGMVSIGDVVKHRLAEMELEAHVLRDLAVAGH